MFEGCNVVQFQSSRAIIESARNSDMQNLFANVRVAGALFSIALLRRATKPASTSHSLSFLRRLSN